MSFLETFRRRSSIGRRGFGLLYKHDVVASSAIQGPDRIIKHEGVTWLPVSSSQLSKQKKAVSSVLIRNHSILLSLHTKKSSKNGFQRSQPRPPRPPPPAPITPFTTDGKVDYDAIQRLGSWLGSIPGVKGLVILGHAGEGTFLTQDEQVSVIKAFVKSVDNRIPIIAGITGEGTEVAALEARRAREAGASAGLLYPSHGWLRFGYQPGAPQDRCRAVYEASGLPLILFQYPDATKATYDLRTLLDISAQPGVFAMKNGVRNMRRWDTEIPVIRRERPGLQVLSCHDEYLLQTAFEVDGILVGYGNVAPEQLIELIEAGKARDYPRARARAIHDRLLPVTKAVYHRGSHMEGTVALKHALVARGILEHATVRSPLLPLEDGAEDEIHSAIASAALARVE